MIDSPTHVLLFYILHILGWFALSAVAAVVSGRGNTIKIKSAAGLGFLTFCIQALIQVLF